MQSVVAFISGLGIFFVGLRQSEPSAMVLGLAFATFPLFKLSVEVEKAVGGTSSLLVKPQPVKLPLYDVRCSPDESWRYQVFEIKTGQVVHETSDRVLADTLVKTYTALDQE